MTTTYFGFAIADSMFPSECTVIRTAMTVQEVSRRLATAYVCLNPSHEPTIKVAREKFGLIVAIPEKAPSVFLRAGDSVIVMSVRGLPRLEGRHEYTKEEIENAQFSFGEWKVLHVLERA